MQHLRRDLAAAAILLVGTVSGHAQGKPLPAPSSSVMPPVELTITAENGKPVCAPAELRLPANTDIALHVVSHADTPVTITAEGFEKLAKKEALSLKASREPEDQHTHVVVVYPDLKKKKG